MIQLFRIRFKAWLQLWTLKLRLIKGILHARAEDITTRPTKEPLTATLAPVVPMPASVNQPVVATPLLTKEQVAEMIATFNEILFQVAQGKNLQTNLTRVEKSIQSLDELIAEAKKNNITLNFDKVRNSLFKLKYEILEQL